MDKNNSHLAGEYFVAAELYRRGYSVAMTLGNAKSIDLFATLDDNPPFNVQVKAIHSKKKSVCWDIKKDGVNDNTWYILVDLRCDALCERPNFYIGRGDEIREQIRTPKSGRDYIDVNMIHNDLFLDRWDKLTNIYNPISQPLYLQDAMITVLKDMPDRKAHRTQLSDEIYKRGLYKMENGRKASPNQMMARASNYPQFFKNIGNGYIQLIS